jgi:hypothetical protein
VHLASKRGAAKGQQQGGRRQRFSHRSFSLPVMKWSKGLTVHPRTDVTVFSYLLNYQQKQEGLTSHEFSR